MRIVITTEEIVNVNNPFFKEWYELSYYLMAYIEEDINSSWPILTQKEKEETISIREEYLEKIYSLCHQFYYDLKKKYYIALIEKEF